MKNVRLFTLALVLGLLAPLLIIEAAGFAHPGEGKLNSAADQSPPLGSFIDIWVDQTNNYQPAVAYNNLHDEYLVVWWNDRGATRDIYAQRVGSDGSLKSWFSVVSAANVWYWLPSIAYSPVQDEYLIAYTYKLSTSDYDIKAKRVKWDGSWMSPEFPINVDKDKQWYPAVAYNSQDNEYLVVYENYWAGGTRDIAAQRVKASDGSLSSWRNIATGPGQVRRLPDVAYNATHNQYLIAYIRLAGSDDDVYARTSSASMSTLSAELILANTYDPEYDVALTSSQDEYLAVWTTNKTPSMTPTVQTISGIRVSPMGTALGMRFPIAENPGAANIEPSVAFSSLYGYMVAWRNAKPSGDDVFGRYIRPGQDVPAIDAFPFDESSDSQKSPAIACAANGSCLLVEEDNYPNPSGDYEIRGRIVWVRETFLPLTLR